MRDHVGPEGAVETSGLTKNWLGRTRNLAEALGALEDSLKERSSSSAVGKNLNAAEQSFLACREEQPPARLLNKDRAAIQLAKVEKEALQRLKSSHSFAIARHQKAWVAISREVRTGGAGWGGDSLF